MQNTRNILLSITLLVCSLSYGQSAKDQLKAVLDAYSTLNRFSVDAEYKAYKTYNSAEAVDHSIAEYRRDGNKLRTKNLGMEYIQNEKYAIIIDDNNKMVLLAKSQAIPAEIFGIENSLSRFEKVVKTGETATTLSYVITFKKNVSEFYKTILVVYKETKLIKRIILFYATDYAVNTQGKPNLKKPKVSISYKNYKTGSDFKFKKDEFNISKYFKSMKGKKKLKEKYKTYEFFDKYTE